MLMNNETCQYLYMLYVIITIPQPFPLFSILISIVLLNASASLLFVLHLVSNDTYYLGFMWVFWCFSGLPFSHSRVFAKGHSRMWAQRMTCECHISRRTTCGCRSSQDLINAPCECGLKRRRTTCGCRLGYISGVC